MERKSRDKANAKTRRIAKQGSCEKKMIQTTYITLIEWINNTWSYMNLFDLIKGLRAVGQV